MLFALVAVASLGLGGCKKQDATDPVPADDEEEAVGEEGVDTNAAESDAQLLTSSLVTSTSTGTIGLANFEIGAGGIQPQTIGDAPMAAYRPRGCLAVTPAPGDAQKATYKFASCAFGPNGLFSINGLVDVHYVAGPGSLHLDLTATDLGVNLATVDWTASADITSSVTARTMTWHAQLSGTTAGGREFARTTDRRVTWTPGEACFELSGLSEGTVGKRSLKTEITGFRRCARSCPDAGTIAVTNLTTGRRIEILYDGTNLATLVRPTGQKVKIRLLCRG
jgi:hypothetical protein